MTIDKDGDVAVPGTLSAANYDLESLPSLP